MPAHSTHIKKLTKKKFLLLICLLPWEKNPQLLSYEITGLVFQLSTSCGLFLLRLHATQTEWFTIMCELDCRNSEESKMRFLNFTTFSSHSELGVKQQFSTVVDAEDCLNY